jgi:hypothetical protein
MLCKQKYQYSGLAKAQELQRQIFAIFLPNPGTS